MKDLKKPANITKSKHIHQANAVVHVVKRGVRYDACALIDKIDAIIFWCGNCKKEYTVNK